MRFFFYLFTFLTFIIITGAVSEMVEVKRGDNIKLNLYTPLENIIRLTAQKDGADVLRYCSSKEKRDGCEDVNVTRFSLVSEEIGASLTCPDADRSDAGTYEVEVIDQKNIPSKWKFTVTFTEPLANNFHPTTPFIHSSPTPDVPKNETTTPVTIGVTVGMIVVLILMAICIRFIYQRRKKNKENHNKNQAENKEFELATPLILINAAPETTDTSINLGNDNNHSERDMNLGA